MTPVSHMRRRLRCNFSHLARPQAFEKLLGALPIKQIISGLNAEEKAITRGQRKPRHIEQRVVGHGQTIERQHAQHCCQSGDKIVISKVTGMKAGQLCKGRPPTFSG